MIDMHINLYHYLHFFVYFLEQTAISTKLFYCTQKVANVCNETEAYCTEETKIDSCSE